MLWRTFLFRRERTMRTQRFIRALITLAIMIALLPIAGCKKSANPNYRANHVDQWSRIKKSGQLNIGVDDSFVPMDFRQKKEAFSRVYERSGQSLVVKKNSGINSFKDMQGKKLGLQEGSTAFTDFNKYPQLLKRYISGSPIIYQDNNSAFMDLKAGRTQGVLAGTIYAGYYAKNLAKTNQYKLIGGNVFPQDRVAVGMRKGDRTLVRKINYALGVLQKDGTLRQINEKWLGIDSNYLGSTKEFKN